jgi:mycothiol synthase
VKLRAPTMKDAAAVAEVVTARSQADLGVAEITAASVEDEWGRSEPDLAAVARIVEDEAGNVVGYGVLRNVGAFAVVSPDAEGQGAGTGLLDWLEQRGRQLGRSKHRQLVASTNRSGIALLSARGYVLVWSEYRMARPLDGTVEEEESAHGLIVRAPDSDDVAAVHAVDARAFATDPGFVPGTLTAFRQAYFEAHDSAPELSRVALAGDQVVGFLIARRWQNHSIGYVDVLGVDPGHQGQGVGRALLLSGFAGFAAAGLNEAHLSVSSANPRALRLYEGAGMKPRFRQDIYERPT